MEENEQNESGWYQGDDETTKALITKKQWKTPESMAKSYSNLEQMNGDQSKIIKLPDFDNAEETSEFYDKLGRPDSSEGYKFEQSGDDKESYALFRKVAYDNGLTPKQAEGIYTDFNSGVSSLNDNRVKEMEERNEQTLAELKTKWGDKYDQKMDLAKAGFREMGFDDSKVEAISAELGIQDTIKLFSHIGKAGSEPSFVDGDGLLKDQTIDEKIQEIYDNPDYLKRGKNKILIEKVMNLRKAKLKIK